MLPFPLRGHRRFQEQLSPYIDGQLPPRRQQRLESHLQSCQPCRRHLEELRATVDALRALPMAEVPRSFALSPQQVEERRPIAVAAPLRVPLRLATAAVAVALAVVAVVDFADFRGGEEGPAAQLAGREEAAALTPAGTPVPEGFYREIIEEATPTTAYLAQATPEPEADQKLASDRAADADAEAPTGAEPLSAPPAAEDAAQDALRLTEIALAALLGLLVLMAFAPVALRRWSR